MELDHHQSPPICPVCGQHRPSLRVDCHNCYDGPRTQAWSYVQELQSIPENEDNAQTIADTVRPSIAGLAGIGAALFMQASALAAVASGVAAAALVAGHRLMTATREAPQDPRRQRVERWRFSAVEADPEIVSEIQCLSRPNWIGVGTKRYRGRVHCSDWWAMLPVDKQSVGLVQAWAEEAHLLIAQPQHGAVAVRLVLSMFRLIARGDLALFAPEVWTWERGGAQKSVVSQPVLSRPPLRLAGIDRSHPTTLPVDEERILSALREAQEFHIADSMRSGLALTDALGAKQLELTSVTLDSVLRKVLTKTDIGYEINHAKLFAPVPSFAPMEDASPGAVGAVGFRDAQRFGGSEALTHVGVDQATFVSLVTRCVEVLERIGNEVRMS